MACTGAAAGLQKDASAFTKLGDALLADSAMSTMLTASLASLSTVDEIKYKGTEMVLRR